MGITITSDAELAAALDRAEELMGCANDSATLSPIGRGTTPADRPSLYRPCPAAP